MSSINTTSELHSDEFNKLFAITPAEIRKKHLQHKQEKYQGYKTHLDEIRNSLREAIKYEKDFEDFSNIDISLDGAENVVEQLDIDACMKEFIESEYIDEGLYFVDAEDHDYIRVKGADAQPVVNQNKKRKTENDDEEDNDEDDLEFFNPKKLTKKEALEVFTGKARVPKQFKFITQALDKLLQDAKQRTIVGGALANGKALDVKIDPETVKKAVEQLILFENRRLKGEEQDAMVQGRKNKTSRAATELQTKFLISPSFFLVVAATFAVRSTTGAKPYIM